jgi:UrcA family protein
MTRIVTRFAASVALCGAFLSAPALAVPVDEGNHAVVRIADLDLATEAGAGALHARIRYAAQRVCGDTNQRDLRGMNMMVACRQVAMDSARPQVELALANARTGRTYAANDVRVTAIGF